MTDMSVVLRNRLEGQPVEFFRGEDKGTTDMSAVLVLQQQLLDSLREQKSSTSRKRESSSPVRTSRPAHSGARKRKRRAQGGAEGACLCTPYGCGGSELTSTGRIRFSKKSNSVQVIAVSFFEFLAFSPSKSSTLLHIRQFFPRRSIFVYPFCKGGCTHG